jgi:hypothetical protein
MLGPAHAIEPSAIAQSAIDERGTTDRVHVIRIGRE